MRENVQNYYNSKNQENKKPIFYSFGTCIFVLIKKLNKEQREELKNIFSKCYEFISNNERFEYEKETESNFSYSNALLSNLVYLINYPNNKNIKQIKLGICISMAKLIVNDKREFNKIRKSIFLDEELKLLSNKKLLRLYKRSSKEFNNSIHLIQNDQEYSREFDKNERLNLKQFDIIEEFKRRIKISKFCKVFDNNEKPQGYVYFIPKTSEDDMFIALYKHFPYSITEFKKKNLHVKRDDGHIHWG